MGNRTVLPLDRNDPSAVKAEEAERHLLDHFDLHATVHDVTLRQPDMRVRVLEVGSGPPVFMVPGGVGDGFVFFPLIAKLHGIRIFVINRPGGGLSDGIDHRQIDFRHFAVQTLTEVLDAFELTSVPVIATSMGGLWSFWLAQRYPERVKALIQLGTPALILNTSAPFVMRLMSVPRLNQWVVPVMEPKGLKEARLGLQQMGSSLATCQALPQALVECAYWFPRLPTFRTAWLSLMERVMNLRGAKPDVQLTASDLTGVQQPVSLIWGDHDPFGRVEVGRQAVDLMPNAQLHVVPGGHLPWLDSTEECADIIRPMLAEYIDSA